MKEGQLKKNNTMGDNNPLDPAAGTTVDCADTNDTNKQVSRGELRIFYILSTVMYKITCTPTFCEGAFIAKQPSCAMCQIKKRTLQLMDPPTLYSNVRLQFETNANSANVMPWGQP